MSERDMKKNFKGFDLEWFNKVSMEKRWVIKEKGDCVVVSNWQRLLA